MEKLVKIAVNNDVFVITEDKDTGKFTFVRVASGTGNRSRIFTANNIVEARNWMRTHSISESVIWVMDEKLKLDEALKVDDYGLNDHVVFSPDVTNPKHGDEAQRAAMTSDFRANIGAKLKLALLRASLHGSGTPLEHDLLAPRASSTGEWGSGEGRHAELFGGTLTEPQREVITKEVADEFKQDAVGIHDPVNGRNKFYRHGDIKSAYLPTNQKEDTEMANEDKITESMFQTGPDNSLTGQSQLDYRNMLAGEIFGAAAFATQRPHSDIYAASNVVMDNQATEGMGVLRPVGPAEANMNEDSSFNKHMLTLAKDLFRAGRMDEAAKIVDAIEVPSEAAQKVLEAAIATDGAVDTQLTETLYKTAAVLNTLNEFESKYAPGRPGVDIQDVNRIAQQDAINKEYDSPNAAQQRRVAHQTEMSKRAASSKDSSEAPKNNEKAVAGAVAGAAIGAANALGGRVNVSAMSSVSSMASPLAKSVMRT